MILLTGPSTRLEHQYQPPSNVRWVKNDQILFIVWIISLIVNNDAPLSRPLSVSGGCRELGRVKLNTREEEEE